ncbi:MAG: MobA/MobL family protein [Lachnospiraceae bacterium]|nr:MobA/MobL family protein [Lachnospiraceae bacterium]
MALYHFHVTQVSRGAGQSVIASAAYRSGEKLHDHYYGESHDYTKKNGVIMSNVIKLSVTTIRLLYQKWYRGLFFLKKNI